MKNQSNVIPRLSVILPVYNAEKYLKESIDSILNQEYKDFELIIINDGSTDNSRRIIENYADSRIILINQNNSGIAKSLNSAINIAKGEYIARMDADDISLPNRFRMQVDYLNKHNNTVLVSSDVIYIDNDSKSTGFSVSLKNERFIKQKLKRGNMIFHPTVIFRKSIFLKTKGYNEIVNKYIEDFILWHEFLKFGEISLINKPLLKYRILENSVSRTSPIGLNKIIKKIGASGGYYPEIDSDFKNLQTAHTITSVKKKYGYNFPLFFYPILSKIINIYHTPKLIIRDIFND